MPPAGEMPLQLASVSADIASGTLPVLRTMTSYSTVCPTAPWSSALVKPVPEPWIAWSFSISKFGSAGTFDDHLVRSSPS